MGHFLTNGLPLTPAFSPRRDNLHHVKNSSLGPFGSLLMVGCLLLACVLDNALDTLLEGILAFIETRFCLTGVSQALDLV